MTMHQTLNVLNCVIYVQKAQFWKEKIKIKIREWPFYYLFLSSSFLPPKIFINFFIITTFLCHGPFLFKKKLKHLFCLSHHNTCWTMSMDNVGLKICLLGVLELHDHSDIFSLVYTEVVPGRIQHPITYFTRPWDNALVHGVNNPSHKPQIYEVQLSCCLCEFANVLVHFLYYF